MITRSDSRHRYLGPFSRPALSPMSDESGDEIFASADEGSDNECTFMKSSYVSPPGSDQGLTTPLIDVSPTESTKIAEDSQQNSMSVPLQKDIDIDVHKFSPLSNPWDANQAEAIQCLTVSVDVNCPLIDLEENSGSEFKGSEKIHSKDSDLDANKSVASAGNAEAKSPGGDLWKSSQIPNVGNISGINEAFPNEISTGDLVEDNRLEMTGGSGIANEVDLWGLDDPWASSQTENTEVGPAKIDGAVSKGTKSQGRVDVTNSKKPLSLSSDKETDLWCRSWDSSTATSPASEPKTCQAKITGMQDGNGSICSKEEQNKGTNSGLNKAEEVWDLEDDPWTSLEPSKVENSSTVNSETVPTQSIQRDNLVFTEKVANLSSVEEVDAWDLENDPWSSSETTKAGTYLASDAKKTCDAVPTPKVKKDGLGTKVEEDWVRAEALQMKSAVNASQELASAATALVKSVGGGLASFVGNFKLSNLSSTLAAFEEKALMEPIEDEHQGNPPQSETSKCHRDDVGVVSVTDDGEAGGGWGAWNLSSLAKSLTSTVENTGLQIIHGGVDVLEQIGRKTFTALKENDPGLVYTKSLLRPANNDQVLKLSQTLREACDQHAAQSSEEPLSSQTEARRGDLASQLESRLALVHMEALELLSSRASARLGTKLARLEAPHNIADDEEHHCSVRSLTAEGGVLERIWQTLQLKDQEGKAEETGEGTSASAPALCEAVAALGAVTPGNALLKICEEVQQKCEQFEHGLPMKEIFYRAVEALADLTSAILAYLHKLAEYLLLLGNGRERFNTGFLDMAEKVSSILTAAKRQNETLCSVYVGHLKEAASSNNTEEVRGEEALTTSRRLVANLFLETGMANGYLDDAAAKYLVPVFQIACLEAFFPESTLTPSSCQPPMSMKAKQR
ncbi:Protein Noxp20 [Taenia crassiceps]|uniref:Protein Noxp20 n=1 Tax=Taenia crassiceps TaxID=6207 RepID=A0ABR4Q1T1_9CEST